MSEELLHAQCIGLLKDLISTPSFSKEEDKTADIIYNFLTDKNSIPAKRKLNNVWAYNKYYDPALPTILLNSHHDTVKPNSGWTKDPFTAEETDGKLFGLGSNDAGGCLVSLIGLFMRFYDVKDMKYNLCLAATAEEEISGTNGIEVVLPELGKIDFAIVGEPTKMDLAIAEKGLLVIDCISHGKSGHAAREEGDNAIYRALRNIEWFKSYRFPKVSDLLGEVKMSVTIIKAGTQHNVVPDKCEFTVDIRVNEKYTHGEIIDLIKKNVSCEVNPRSTRLRSSFISKDHPIVKTGIELRRRTYGSPTTSDQALINVPSLKMGPGDSARSHTADEFIYIDEIKEGIDLYIKMLEQII